MSDERAGRPAADDHERARPATGRVEVLGGHCAVEDRELVVSRSPLRAVHPVGGTLVVALLLVTVLEVATGPNVTGARIGDDRLLLAVGVLPVVFLLVDLYRTGVLGPDVRVPLGAIRDVRIETERRRWYFKTRREVPMVVLTVEREGGTVERSIRFRASDGQRAATALVDLLARHGVDPPRRDSRAEPSVATRGRHW